MNIDKLKFKKEVSELNNKLLKGFNTFDSTSVLSHVLMPYGLAFRFGFKDYATCGNNVSILKDALIGDTFDGKQALTPSIRSYDGSYTELEVDFYGIKANIKTHSSGEDLYVLIEPLRKSECPTSVFAEICMLWNRKGYVERTEDSLMAKIDDKIIRLYTTGSELKDNYLFSHCPFINVTLNEKVLFSTKKISLSEGERIINKNREKFAEQTSKNVELEECYKGLMSVISWELVYEPNNDELFSTVSRLWSKPAGGYAVFGWDMFFTALMFSIVNIDISYSNIYSILREQTKEGIIPNYSCANGFKSYDHSQPIIGSLVLREIYKKTKDIIIFSRNQLLM